MVVWCLRKLVFGPQSLAAAELLGRVQVDYAIRSDIARPLCTTFTMRCTHHKRQEVV